MSDERFKVGPGPDGDVQGPGRQHGEAAARVAEAAGRGAQVICLPEMYRTPYFCQTETHAHFDLAEPARRPVGAGAWRAVARAHGVAVVVPIFERRAPGLYHNSAVILDADGSLAGVYRKMHIPDDPAFYEKFYFTPGDLGFQAVDTRHGRIGTLICWDQWYPEARPPHRPGRRRGALLPDRHRLAPGREGRVRRRPARRLADHPARPRHRQRLLRGGGQPRRPRAGEAGGRRPGVLGQLASSAIPFGVVVAEALHRPGGDPGGHRSTSAQHRGGAPPLALPARPAHRRLRRPHPAVPRLTAMAASAPAAQGFAMPAEWDRHEATWLAWPHNVARLARQVRAHPVGLRRDRPPPGARRDGAPARCSTRPTSGRCGRSWSGSACRSTPSTSAASPPTGSGPATPGPSGWPAAATPPARAIARFRLQRLGQVPRLEEATTASRRAPPGRSRVPLLPAIHARPRGGARGRRHRRQRARHPPHHRGVPARPAVQVRNPGFGRAGLRGGLRRGAGRAQHHLAGQGHRRRRHPRPRGRPGAASSTPAPSCSAARRTRATRTTPPLEENRERLEGARLEDGSRPRGGLPAHARAGGLRRPAAAGQLRQLLHRQRRRAGADLQRPERPRGARASSASSSATGR